MYDYDANGNITGAARFDQDGEWYDFFAYKYQKQPVTGRLTRNRLYDLLDETDPNNLLVNESGGAVDIEHHPDDPHHAHAGCPPSTTLDENLRWISPCDA